MLRTLVFLGVVWYALAGSAAADPYWIAYEGDDFPENEGWERNTHAGGAQRWIEDGALVIDSMADLDIADSYKHLDVRRPEDGEVFMVEWRMRLDQYEHFYDARIGLARPAPSGDILIAHGMDHVVIFDGWDTVPVAAGQWHQYRLETADMDVYTLYVDGQPSYEGMFQTPSLLEPLFTFGSGFVGASSLSRWDYVRFGIVPEPSSSLLLAFAIVATCGSVRRHRRL